MKTLSSTLCALGLLAAACAPRQTPFSFVQLTDTQLRFTRDTGMEGVSDFQLDSLHAEQAVAQTNELCPDFVIVTGDMVHDPYNESDQKAYQQIISKIKAPVYHIPGNHDIRNGKDPEAISAYVTRFGYDRFSFAHNGFAIIGINSNIIIDGNEQAETEQFEWLQGELQKAKAKAMPVYLFTHCPVFLDLFDEGPSYNAFPQPLRRKYWDAFKEGGVKAIIAGHLHRNHATEFEGIETVITGPIGFSFEGSGKEGFRLWNITPEGHTSEFLYLNAD